MAWDLAHTEVLNFRGRVLTDHFVRPQVPNLNQLIGTSDDAQVLHPELKVVVSGLAPVHNRGNCMATCNLGRVDLRMPPEGIPL